LPGQTLAGTQALSTLQFAARADVLSSSVPLRISNMTANQTNGTPVTTILSDDGSVVLVNSVPIMGSALVGGQFQLTLYAPAGPGYILQSTPSLTPPIVWSPILTSSVGTNLFQVLPMPVSNSSRFYRVKTP
jgi:hypothetical protein